MKESARAALTFAATNVHRLDIPAGNLGSIEAHIHVPAGAIPKDGPSAGVTMTTALASVLSGRPVRQDVAMTGEITLRGRVLPIGGIKEKILGARRAGIEQIILPYENQAELEDLPEDVKEALEFHFVRTLDEVLKIALLPPVDAPYATQESIFSSLVPPMETDGGSGGMGQGEAIFRSKPQSME
jgi:ATP-dependent Lon protease